MVALEVPRTPDILPNLTSFKGIERRSIGAIHIVKGPAKNDDPKRPQSGTHVGRRAVKKASSGGILGIIVLAQNKQKSQFEYIE